MVHLKWVRRTISSDDYARKKFLPIHYSLAVLIVLWHCLVESVIGFRNGTEAMEGQEHRVYHARVDSSGRIVIPADMRSRHQIKEGDTLVVVEDNLGLHVKSLDQAIADAQAYFISLAPASRVLSREVLADRRSEAERD